MKHSIAPLLKGFFGHYLPVQKGLSINTLRAYRDAVKLLLCYIADHLRKPVEELSVEDLTESLVLGCLNHIEARGCTRRTRNARLAAIRSLFAYIAREEPVLLEQCHQIRSIPLKRTSYKRVDYLEEKEMQAVLNAVNAHSRTGLRDRALLMLLYNTGARVTEIVTLVLADLRLDGTPQVRLRGKGDKTRSCPLWPETTRALQAYLAHRQPKQEAELQLFLNANGNPITRFGIRYLTQKYGTAAQAKLPGLKSKSVNPHTIRHATAMHLLHSGNDINMISYWLGHADLNTTHVYVEIDMEAKRKMLAKANAPKISRKASWHRPHILEWLQQLTKQPELCEVNRQTNRQKPTDDRANFT